MIKPTLKRLFEFQTLTRQEAREVLTGIATEKYNHSEIVAFITAYMMRSVTVEELSGFRDAMQELCVKVDLSGFNTIDMCGTGGDGKDTFNISTLASLVVAGAGVKVAKHGNYGVSSSCGSSNVMEYLGYKFTNDEATIQRQIDKAGICFLHAPMFHPAMKVVAPMRRELGMKTFFNMLGPVLNPSFPKNQLLGVFSLELARLYNYIYQQTEKQYVIIHALDGYDEVSLTGPFKAIFREGEKLWTPMDLGFKQIKQDEIYGGATVAEAAKIFTDILEGKGTQAQVNVVVANAALAIKCVHPQRDLQTCLDEARLSLESGAAKSVLKKLIETESQRRRARRRSKNSASSRLCVKRNMNILDKIIARKNEEVAAAKQLVSIADLEDSKYFEWECPSLRASLLDPSKTGIIAEFKRQSPSKGIINDTALVPDVTKGYEAAGASGISILTDPDFFGGNQADLTLGHESVAIPILRKDFMVDVYQVFEAKSWGASAILLIAAALTDQKARELGSMAKALGMDVLMEVHNREELDLVNEYVDIVGVNNRDLKTFSVSLERSVELAALMPANTVKISESGIYSVEDIHYLRKHGFQGFLIGENFMRTANPGQACIDFTDGLRK
jgi:anthranilate phosphoribosyltransferase